MTAESSVSRDGTTRVRRRRVWVWLALAALVVLCVLGVSATIMLRRAGPILKGRVIGTLRTRFNSDVELDRFDVAVLHGFDVSGGGLRIYPPDDVRAAGATAPLIAVREFSFHAGWRGLFVKPTRIGTVHISGMAITIPPRQMRRPGAPGHKRAGKINVHVDTLLFDDSRLILQTNRPDKDPKTFELRHIELRDLGGAGPSEYHAVLSNAIPRGEIDSSGTFGPWNTESPGDSAVTGHYVFDHADLSTIRGIGGMLHSAGEFSGQLNRIEVFGATETPDFFLDTARHPMPLRTSFHAIVDGLSGDTYLMPVQARLGRSDLTCKGAVVNIHGEGHMIDLMVDVPDGHIEDFLRLAVKSSPVIMTGRVRMHAKVHIPPGRVSVAHKLDLRSDFALREIHFTNPKTQSKLDDLSLRAQGDAKNANPGAADVHSTMAGSFVMHSERIDFSRMQYGMPGAEIELTGTYTIPGEAFDFAGEIRTQAKLSQMVSTWWKSWLLRPVDPFFHKQGAGAVIPIRISGTKDSPKFALDLGRKGEKHGP